MKLLITNGILHDAVTPEPFRSDILIENGRIVRIAKKIKAAASMQVIDAAGKNIYPGMVEAHCHLGVDGFAIQYAGADYNEYNDAVTPQLNAIDGINPFDPTLYLAAAAGVTTVGTGPGSSNVLGGTFAAIKTAGKRVDDMAVKAKAAMKCAFGENPKNCYKSKKITSRMTTAALLREALAKAAEYEAKLQRAAGDPEKMPAWDAKNEALLPVIRREIPLKAHAHRADDLCTAIRIAKEFNVRLTLEHVTEGALIAEILAAEGLPLAVGPTFGSCSKAELMQKDFSTPGILHRAGCQVSIITDSAVLPQESLGLMAAMAVEFGMDKFAAFQAVTINPAKHLGIEDQVGSLEVGKDGDLIIASGELLSLNPGIEAVYIRGKKVERPVIQFDLPLSQMRNS